MNEPGKSADEGGRFAFTTGGELGRLIAEHDWSESGLGPIEHWPQSLKTSVSLILSSSHPMWIGWGPQATFLYNDAYIQVLSSAKHPWALGRPAAEVWAEIWDVCGPLADSVFARGEASFVDEVRLFMSRGDFLEETYYSFSYSPIRDESGAVGGLFCPSAETTHKVLSARRLKTLSELAANALIEKSAEAACASAVGTLSKNPDDLPFALLYLIDPHGNVAHLTRGTGLQDAAPYMYKTVVLDGDSHSPWPLGAVASSEQTLVLPVADLTLLPLGLADRRIDQAVVLPVRSSGVQKTAAVLVAGVNPTRKLDQEYRAFYELIAAQVGGAIQNARAAEEEREKARQLAELDQAKTAFFSNVSHEFRTPLTLMMGPLEDSLLDTRERLSLVQRERLETAHRNSQRLLRLVNTLLDFSRIEAGRTRASFEPTDLGVFTAELASNFRSAIEKAGLWFEVDCPALSAPVCVDRDMWEKIVLNLLSNALKFTFQGGIQVRLQHRGNEAQLTVRDTGVGIPPEHLPRLFERFHRVEGQRSRTHEGSGIGLALIHELIRLHHGRIDAQSCEGKGTTFTLCLPLGSAHLPADQVANVASTSPAPARAAAFVQEALSWLPGTEAGVTPLAESEDSIALSEVRGARVLLADDNADMRQYVARLLSPHLEVETVANGRQALAALEAHRPDLVLTDVMMPELDGFGLLQEIRDCAATRDLPVIMLSARAGEEARIEGITRGADDYLVKPFSARELVARVNANLRLAQVRRAATAALTESEARFRNMADHAPVMMWVTDANGMCTYLNYAWHEFTGQSEQEGLGTGWLAASHPDDRQQAGELFQRANSQREAFRLEYRLRRHDGEYCWVIDAAAPRFSGAGEFLGYVGSVIDITERKTAEQAVRELNETLQERVAQEMDARSGAEEALRQAQKMEALGQLTGGIAHDFNNMLSVIIGNLDMLQRRLLRGEANVHQYAEFALEGANRAATLTERLLAFARRQPLRPEPLQPNRLVAGMSDLLHRTLGETIRTETVLAGGLWRIHTDANQLESAIVNLAVNARDAMPNGGRLTIETANAHLDDAYAAAHAGVAQGQYVLIAVTDTGSGMTLEVMRKAFDPFFTTKPVGRGTGLGLSQVYGFVHQSGGHVKIYSELGEGTTVKIYLPRFFGNGVSPTLAQGRAATETRIDCVVLVVEDEASVRHVSVEALKELGCTVIEADNAVNALQILDMRDDIAVLFTDVVMPDINGRQLADEALRRRPDLKVLFTTGYTRNAIVHNGVLDPGVQLIGKPFNLEQLGRKLREVCG